MTRHKSTWNKLSGLLGLVILLSFSAACSSTFRVRAGNRPNPELLETSLRFGESTRADVLAALGEPIGRGRAKLPVDPRIEPQTMWSYYYEEAILWDIRSKQPAAEGRRIFVFVFFDEDRYDGYMWFSSLPK